MIRRMKNLSTTRPMTLKGTYPTPRCSHDLRRPGILQSEIPENQKGRDYRHAREDKAEALLEAGKIVELKPCHVCGEHGWWLSARGVLACGVCHPPVPGAVKKWIGNRRLAPG